MNIPVLLLGLVFTSTSAQNIYEGCGSEKECLGFVKGMDDTQTTCMETEDCTLVVAFSNSTTEGYATFEVMHVDADAAGGWVAIGFGRDKAMGDDAVVLATEASVTSRWNIAVPHDALVTDDIGVKNEMVQVDDGMIYVTMEIPKLFSIVNPQDGNATEVNLDQGNYFMAAAGDLLPNGGANKHRQANVAANMISMGSTTTTTTTTTSTASTVTNTTPTPPGTTTTENGASTTITTTENGANGKTQSWITLAALALMVLFNME